MKKLAVILIIALFVFAGCSESEPQIDPNLVQIEITYSDSENITFDVINNYSGSIEFGSEYFIEYFDGEKWLPLEERTETFFTMIANILSPGEKMNFSYELAARYGKLSSGKYRVYKDINLLNEDGVVCGSQRAFAEFEIFVKEK